MGLQNFGSEGFLAFWNSMTSDQRDEMVKNLENFHSMISSMRNRKIIYTDKNLTTITIIKKDDDVYVLEQLYEKIKPSGMKLVYDYPKTNS